MTYDHNQTLVPDSFGALYARNGIPTLGRQELEGRYELSESLAEHVAEFCRTRAGADVSEDVALRRCFEGLLATPETTSPAEAGWVTRRVAELLEWDSPDWLTEAG